MRLRTKHPNRLLGINTEGDAPEDIAGGVKAVIGKHGVSVPVEGKRVLSPEAVREMQADQARDAEVKAPEYLEGAVGRKHHGVYGLGQWRMFVNDQNQAEILSSPSFAGFIPRIDKKRGIAGVFVGRATGGIDAFHESAKLIPLVNTALDNTQR